MTAKHTSKQGVLGFLFNEDPESGVALTTLPNSNLLSGICGYVEPQETPALRIIRASLQTFGTTPPIWHHFATLVKTKESEYKIIFCYYARNTQTLREIKQLTKEPLLKIYVRDLSQHSTAPGIQRLIALALSNPPSPVNLSVDELEAPVLHT
jgi:hypothetical protein